MYSDVNNSVVAKYNFDSIDFSDFSEINLILSHIAKGIPDLSEFVPLLLSFFAHQIFLMVLTRSKYETLTKSCNWKL